MITTTERGVVIRNLVQVPNRDYRAGYSYTFEAQVRDEWWPCAGPCGDWTAINGKDGREAPQFSVSVGWWELDRLYNTMLEGEKLAGEVFKQCRGWHTWEQVCDLMAACISGQRKDIFHVAHDDNFLCLLEKQFPDKSHRMWANVYIVKKLDKAV